MIVFAGTWAKYLPECAIRAAFQWPFLFDDVLPTSFGPFAVLLKTFTVR